MTDFNTTTPLNDTGKIALPGKDVLKVFIDPNDPEVQVANPISNYLTFSLIQNGSSGNDVAFAQYMLYIFMPDYAYGLAQDGQFGPATTQAVRTFQSYSGLGVDGIVGSNTWQRLAPVVMAGYSDSAGYWRADRIVWHVQYLLVLGGKLNSNDLDGVYGTRTQNAIKTFQRIYGLTQDGKWGRQCWNIIAQGYL